MANRVILGEDAGTYVLKVSRAGVNVLTAADDDLIFDSTKDEAAFPLLQGSVSVTTASDGSGTSSWISYGTTLNYFPVVFCSRVTSGNIIPVPEVDLALELEGTGTKSDPSTEDRSTNYTRTYLDIEKSRFRVQVYKEHSNYLHLRNNIIGANTTYTFYYNVVAVGGATPL